MITEGWQGQKSFWRARRREWKWDSVQQSGIVAPPAEFRERLCQFPGTRYQAAEICPLNFCLSFSEAVFGA